MAGAWASRFVALQRERDEAVIRDAFRFTRDASPPGVTSVPPATPPPATTSLVDRVRPLVAEGHGRTAIVRRLGVTDHQARQAIATVKAEKSRPLHAVGGTR